MLFGAKTCKNSLKKHIFDCFYSKNDNYFIY